jgi:hypothetical protein
MVRLCGRCVRGERLVDHQPQGSKMILVAAATGRKIVDTIHRATKRSSIAPTNGPTISSVTSRGSLIAGFQLFSLPAGQQSNQSACPAIGAQEFLVRWHQPHQELEECFDRGGRPASVVDHGPVEKRDQSYALDPRLKEVKLKDLTFWPTESPDRYPGAGRYCYCGRRRGAAAERHSRHRRE